ncbi:hypothetical protein [Methylobacillus flagellatus]|uniref:hypothetical protein n=1 Tax=Methylobacillus flagellatus TaxID=405 RepID=UPI001BB15870|nr:hypothetical protein [Methylobacillus flagellatus]
MQTASSTNDYDVDLPKASDLLASLSWIATRYVNQPSADLAKVALNLARKLQAPHYAESRLVSEVAGRLVAQWQDILHSQSEAATPEAQDALMCSIQPGSGVVH